MQEYNIYIVGEFLGTEEAINSHEAKIKTIEKYKEKYPFISINAIGAIDKTEDKEISFTPLNNDFIEVRKSGALIGSLDAKMLFNVRLWALTLHGKRINNNNYDLFALREAKELIIKLES